jgi:uncharacterized protein (TIGR03066 family)
MNTLRLLLAGVMAVTLTAGTQAEKKEEKKDTAKLLGGTWEVVKAAPGTLPVGSIMEFGKEGKLKLSVKAEGKEHQLDATYKVDGNKIALTVSLGDEEKKQILTIKKISQSDLSFEDEDGKSAELKRKK